MSSFDRVSHEADLGRRTLPKRIIGTLKRTFSKKNRRTAPLMQTASAPENSTNDFQKASMDLDSGFPFEEHAKWTPFARPTMPTFDAEDLGTPVPLVDPCVPWKDLRLYTNIHKTPRKDTAGQNHARYSFEEQSPSTPRARRTTKSSSPVFSPFSDLAQSISSYTRPEHSVHASNYAGFAKNQQSSSSRAGAKAETNTNSLPRQCTSTARNRVHDLADEPSPFQNVTCRKHLASQRDRFFKREHAQAPSGVEATASRINLQDSIDEMAVPIERPNLREPLETLDPESDTESEFPFDGRRASTKLQVPEFDTSEPEQDDSPHDVLQNVLNHRRERIISEAIRDITLNDWSSSVESEETSLEKGAMYQTKPFFVVNASPSHRSSSTASRETTPKANKSRPALGEINLNNASSTDFRANDSATDVFNSRSPKLAKVTSPKKQSLAAHKGLKTRYRAPPLAAKTKVQRECSEQMKLCSKFARQPQKSVRSAIQDFEDKIMENRSQAGRRLSQQGSTGSSPITKEISKGGSKRTPYDLPKAVEDRFGPINVAEWSQRVHHDVN